MHDSWLDDTGCIRHSREEIEWMEAIDRQDREIEARRRALKPVVSDVLIPMSGICLNGRRLFRNRYTGDICYEDGDIAG